MKQISSRRPNFQHRTAAVQITLSSERSRTPLVAFTVPGQIAQAEAAGILSAAEAAFLRGYDAKVSYLTGVDDFAPHELRAGTAGADSASI